MWAMVSARAASPLTVDAAVVASSEGVATAGAGVVAAEAAGVAVLGGEALVEVLRSGPVAVVLEHAGEQLLHAVKYNAYA